MRRRRRPRASHQPAANGPRNAPDQGPPCEPLYAELRREPEAACDDGTVVEQRGGRLSAEASLGHEGGAHDRTGNEEDLRGEHDPGEVDGERLPLGIEAGELQRHE